MWSPPPIPVEDLARYLNPSLTASEWLPEFETFRHGLDYQNENKPYVEARREFSPDDTEIAMFMGILRTRTT